MQYVYILKRSDNNYYTGCTNDLKDRFDRHQKGYVDSTRDFRPLELAYYCAFSSKGKAFAFEKYLKSGSGIAFRNKHLL
ncbi:GIY-YIG nuclease family protein [Lacibacter luteus]|uniref:GIY-YIG nuclease family protein n=1 Tax=Lacibacter luteus TaxID=2508719 RepID=A0A4Q1CMI1_9BACT|nr:GIY-YIG nuclease family protein [Lacibacter luteus]RXK61901.1 GIY-YIG nuclease family protein [Lacibacter luteus]